MNTNLTRLVVSQRGTMTAEVSDSHKGQSVWKPLLAGESSFMVRRGGTSTDSMLVGNQLGGKKNHLSFLQRKSVFVFLQRNAPTKIHLSLLNPTPIIQMSLFSSGCLPFSKPHITSIWDPKRSRRRRLVFLSVCTMNDIFRVWWFAKTKTERKRETCRRDDSDEGLSVNEQLLRLYQTVKICTVFHLFRKVPQVIVKRWHSVCDLPSTHRDAAVASAGTQTCFFEFCGLTKASTGFSFYC